MKHADKILSLEDYGIHGSTLSTEETSGTADYALVFCVQSSSENTFQPIGYFLTHSRAKASALADIRVAISSSYNLPVLRFCLFLSNFFRAR